MKNPKIILLLSHNSGVDGPIDYYENYLIRNDHKVIKLSHPLYYYGKQQFTRLFNQKKLIHQITRNDRFIFSYLFDLFYSIYQIIKLNFKVGIGANKFDTLALILSRKILFKKIDKIIYYASDYSENRTGKKFLDKVYNFIEHYVLKNTDLTVSNTHRAEAKRLSLGLRKEKSIVVPNGVHLKNPVFKPKKIKKNKFIFIGNVTRTHGLYELIEAMHQIIDELTIIGQGEYFDKVVELCKQLNIKLIVHKQKSHEFVIEYLQKFDGFGLAPYNKDSQWTNYCSPLKVSEYISCGVPVIVSDVPEISKYINDEKLGVVFKANGLSLTEKIKSFDTNQYYLKSSLFFQKYNSDTLFAKLVL